MARKGNEIRDRLGTVKLLEIRVEADGEAAEAVSAVLSRYCQGGPVVEESWPANASLSPAAVVKGFLTEEQSSALPQLEEALWHLGQILPIPSPTVRWLSESDWTGAWKSGYRVQRIGQRIVIKPSWRRYRATGDQVVIELDPGLAFGTGLHPSTRLCLLALEECLRPGCRVLDVGTGSGILAIAAVRLGAERVVALDVDSLALQVARENVARNGVQDAVSLHRASLDAPSTLDWPAPGGPVDVFNSLGTWDESFDLLTMNILADVIARSAPAIAACLVVTGKFVLSGIIQSREDDVCRALAAAGLAVLQRRRCKDWVALIGGKENRRSDTP